MDKAKLKFLVPNGITFLSLTCGVSAILSATQEKLVLSGILIFASYWLDSLDGFSARKLNAQSEFGLHMDSLTDMVSLGMAPALLVFQHLRLQGANIIWVIPLVTIYTMAGAFRLARFNTLPPKTSNNLDSIGLTISQSGGTLTLAVLADNLQASSFLPMMTYIPLLLVLGVLMVSRILFPPSSWFFKTHKAGWVLLFALLLLLFIFPIFSTWFIIYIVYIAISTLRALIYKLRPQLST
jgi:CDP-diacylglycerol--serine O-phosphatidyltransferase